MLIYVSIELSIVYVIVHVFSLSQVYNSLVYVYLNIYNVYF